MAPLVQEQLLDISIVYQRLQFRSENDISEKCETWPTPRHMVITPPPPHALHPSGFPYCPESGDWEWDKHEEGAVFLA